MLAPLAYPPIPRRSGSPPARRRRPGARGRPPRPPSPPARAARCARAGPGP